MRILNLLRGRGVHSMVLRLLLLYALAVLGMFLAQRHFMYHAGKLSREAFEHRVSEIPGKVEVLPSFDAVVLSPSGLASRGIAVWLHGNAGTALDREIFARAARTRGYRLVLAEYPGYGVRSGSPSETTLVSDALALVHALRQKYPGEALTLVGESLGSGVAAQVAAELAANPQAGGPAQRVVLLTPFSSMRAVAARAMPLLPARYLVRDTFDSLSVVSQIPGPMAVLIATEDELVGAADGRILAQAIAARPGQLSRTLEVRAGHNYWAVVIEERHWDELLGERLEP